MKRKTHILFLSVLLFCFCSVGYGQDGNGNPPPNPGKGKGGPPPPPGLPIDGGITYLLIAGLAYGVFEKNRNK